MGTDTLSDWLGRIEQLHSKSIDLGLDRVRAVAGRLGLKLEAPTIVVGGTNGKGSTCAMLDSILRAAGYRVGLYTSPHLLEFNERCRIDGVNAADADLIEHFEAVEAARDGTSLTYFEFTTLAILRLLGRAPLDALVLEIGLGGRLDAVNIVDADVAIVTSVDLDHMDYLGPTREDIGREKAHIYRPGRPAICSDPAPPESLLDHAAGIGADLWRFGRDFNYQGDRQQWAYAGRRTRRSGLPYPALRGANQLLNASGVLAALEVLAGRLPVSQQAVRQGLLTVELPGRFQILPGRPAVILDVAHNPHAAAVLADNLDNMGFHPATHAVFGMLRDKDIGGVIARLGDRIDHWHVAPTPGERGCDAATIAASLRARAGGRECRITEYPDLAAAFDGARERAGADDRILAFGSFLTVAEVMRAIRARPAAAAA
ncbi:MAG: bifunctional tetrahydrofolate synthase/dihydrofolate synthase [Betaproteobacteria bacterium]